MGPCIPVKDVGKLCTASNLSGTGQASYIVITRSAHETALPSGVRVVEEAGQTTGANFLFFKKRLNAMLPNLYPSCPSTIPTVPYRFPNLYVASRFKQFHHPRLL
jgi:hypothetical protein